MQKSKYLGWPEYTLKRIITRFREDGVSGVFSAIRKRLAPRKPPQLRGFKGLLPLFRDKYGLEVGGPSAVFKADGLMPVYQSAGRIDGCNFANQTIWEGQIQEGMSYQVGKEVGYQFIAEASELKMICSAKYDFLLASHCLEHVANPLGALSEWLRVLKDGGILVLLLPDKSATFDHRRPVTAFSHLLQDLNKQTPEDDLTHLDEILALHNLEMDLLAGNKESFEKRSRANLSNRCLHHHVFDMALIKDVFQIFWIKYTPFILGTALSLDSHWAKTTRSGLDTRQPAKITFKNYKVFC